MLDSNTCGKLITSDWIDGLEEKALEENGFSNRSFSPFFIPPLTEKRMESILVQKTSARLSQTLHHADILDFNSGGDGEDHGFSS